MNKESAKLCVSEVEQESRQSDLNFKIELYDALVSTENVLIHTFRGPIGSHFVLIIIKVRCRARVTSSLTQHSI